jgi:prolyl oligopeptidase
LTGEASEWAAPKLTFDPIPSPSTAILRIEDGTRVPMFVVRKKGSTGPAPTILYGYGGSTLR